MDLVSGDAGSQNAPKRGWALGYAEDYDARREPPGWDAKIFDVSGWDAAVLVKNPPWQGLSPRLTPHLERRLIPALTLDAFVAPDAATSEIAAVSAHSDEETLISSARNQPANFETIHAALQGANALTFDLGREIIGFTHFEIEAPPGMVIEVSGAELLRDGRP